MVPLASQCSLLEVKQWNGTADTPYYSSIDQLDSDSANTAGYFGSLTVAYVNREWSTERRLVMSLEGIGFISNGAFCFAEPMRKSVDKID